MNQSISELHTGEQLKGNYQPRDFHGNSRVLYLKKPMIVQRDGRYALYDNGIICDCYAGQEWLCNSDDDINWVDASTWATSAKINGGGWQLPSIKDLNGLYKRNKAADLLSPLFNRTPGDFWSKETINDAEVLGYNFVPGNTFRTFKTISRQFRAMAVRPRQHYHKKSDMSLVSMDIGQ